MNGWRGSTGDNVLLPCIRLILIQPLAPHMDPQAAPGMIPEQSKVSQRYRQVWSKTKISMIQFS